MRWAVDHVVYGANFHNAPSVHHGDAVAGFGNHPHVVRNQHDGGMVLFANIFEQGNDLCLNRHIQGGGGLIRHNQFGFPRQRQGNDRTLAHTARKLVRIVLHALLGGADASLLQQGYGTRTRLGGIHGQMGLNGFHQLLPHGVQRVERSQRVLKNRANAPPPNRPHLRVVEMVNALPLQQHLP